MNKKINSKPGNKFMMKKILTAISILFLTAMFGLSATIIEKNAMIISNDFTVDSNLYAKGTSTFHAVVASNISVEGTATFNTIVLGSNGNSFSNWPGETNLTSQNEATLEPSGFESPQNIIVSYDNSTKMVTLTQSGGVVYWWRGQKYTLESPWTSSAHDAGAVIYYLAARTSSNFEWSTDAWTFDMVQAAIVTPVDSAGLTNIGIKECHGLMPWSTHQSLHQNIGTYRVSGLIASSYVTNSDTATNKTPSFLAGVVQDEDLATSISAVSTGGPYSWLYFSTTGVINILTNQASLTRAGAGNYGLYNRYINGSFSDVEIGNNQFFNYYQIILPVTSDTMSQHYRILILQPQNVYSTLAAAQAEDFRTLFLGNFTSLSPEFVPFAKLTFQSLTTYSLTPLKSRLQSINYLTGSKATQVSIATMPVVSSANAITVDTSTFTSNLTAADSTVQQALNTLDGLPVAKTNEQNTFTKTNIFSGPVYVTSGDTPYPNWFPVNISRGISNYCIRINGGIINMDGNTNHIFSIVRGDDNNMILSSYNKIGFAAGQIATAAPSSLCEMMIADNAIGIGTNNPQAKLHIVQPNGVAFRVETSTNSLWWIDSTNYDQFKHTGPIRISSFSCDRGTAAYSFMSDGTNVFSLAYDGDMYIGQTSSLTATDTGSRIVDYNTRPSLSIYDMSPREFAKGGKINLGARYRIGNDPVSVSIEGNLENTNENNYAMGIVFVTYPQGGSPTSNMWITSNGRVGIKTNNPASILHVNGLISTGTNSPASWSSIYTHGTIGIGGDSYITSEWDNRPLRMKARAGNYSDFEMSTAGNLGIGTNQATSLGRLMVCGGPGSGTNQVSIWSEFAVSAANFIDRTSAWDEDGDSALKHIKKGKDLLDGNGKISHSKFATYEQFIITSTEVVTDSNQIVHTNIVQRIEGIDLSKRSAKHEQAIYELVTIITNLQYKIEQLEKNK